MLNHLYQPKTLSEALTLLAQQPEAKALAGGATLVAMLNARVIAPPALVSLAGIDELRGIRTLPDGRVRVGAFARHRETAGSEALTGSLTVVRDAARQIANATIRNMGTIGGAIACADPGLDYPPALVAARAQVEHTSLSGVRYVNAAEFFVDWYATALQPGELVSAVILPRSTAGYGRYHKLARIAGDYATVSIALAATGDALRVAVGACGPKPIALDEVDQLVSAERSAVAIARAAQLLLEHADPVDDVRGSAEYRRMVLPRLLAAALREFDSWQKR